MPYNKVFLNRRERMANYIIYEGKKLKVGFDPGHGDGANVDPKFPNYSEGTNMRILGEMLRDKYGTPITRETKKDISFSQRIANAKSQGVKCLISIHSNYPAKGVIIFRSIFRPQDQILGDAIGQIIAKELGIQYRGTTTRRSDKGNWDYYGMIRQPYNAGMIPLIVEHGSHEELATDTKKKLEKIVKAYGEILGTEIKGGNSVVVLRQGDKGSAVKELQNDLIELGYGKYMKPYGADGSFGPATRNAVLEFQRDYKLKVDGIAGPETKNKISALLKAKTKPVDKLAEAKKLAQKILDL